MLVGSAAADAHAERAPRLSWPAREALALPRARVLQCLFEIESQPLCALLPPALHPTLPPIVCWNAYQFPESPWGTFSLAQTRIQCRSGLRPRGLLLSAVVDAPAAADALARGWGFRCRPGQIAWEPTAQGSRLRVEGSDGACELALRLEVPVELPAADVQFVAGMHPAHTERGYRLVQVDLDHAIARAQRGRPVLEHFDAAAWGDARVRPCWPVSISAAEADVTLAPLRYFCRPELSAFAGTEAA